MRTMPDSQRVAFIRSIPNDGNFWRNSERFLARGPIGAAKRPRPAPGAMFIILQIKF